MMKTKYTICSTGNSEHFIYYNGYFVENQEEHMIPGIIGTEGYISFFDEKWNQVVLINRHNIIWIKRLNDEK